MQVDDDDRLYAMVRFDGSDRSQVSEVVVAFETCAAADRFARARGVATYVVGPMGFLTDHEQLSTAAPALRPASSEVR